MPAIKVENLTKKFNGFAAVDGISFDVQEGEIFGLLGPNGAGKTTTISMLSTILKPTSGTAIVNNLEILKDEDGVRKSIGIVFQDQSLDEELTADENMDFHGRLYRIDKNTRQKRSMELLRLVGLEERKDDPVKKFSSGMKRRLEIARGLLHQPRVLFLDEPTLGLDPQTRNHIWLYIEKLNEETGVTIILTTHYMEEAEKLCDRVAIIDKGKIIALNTPQKLKDEIGGDIITIKSPDPDKIYSKITAPWTRNERSSFVGYYNMILHSKIIATKLFEFRIKYISNILYNSIKNIERHDGFVTINLQNAEKHITEIVNLSTRNNIDIESISIHKPTLEDVFLQWTGKTIREQEANSKDHMRMHHRSWRR